jgi:hypothetical protein
MHNCVGGQCSMGTASWWRMRREHSCSDCVPSVFSSFVRVSRAVLQNDFFRGGSFPLPDAESVIPILNTLRQKQFDMVLVCTLEHAINHNAFASNHPVRTLCSLGALNSLVQLVAVTVPRCTVHHRVRSYFPWCLYPAWVRRPCGLTSASRYASAFLSRVPSVVRNLFAAGTHQPRRVAARPLLPFMSSSSQSLTTVVFLVFVCAIPLDTALLVPCRARLARSSTPT